MTIPRSIYVIKYPVDNCFSCPNAREEKEIRICKSRLHTTYFIYNVRTRGEKGTSTVMVHVDRYETKINQQT